MLDSSYMMLDVRLSYMMLDIRFGFMMLDNVRLGYMMFSQC